MKNDDLVVNGATMSREFFEANLAEAMPLCWVASEAGADTTHHHCIVCTASLPSPDDSIVYKVGHRYLCAHCFLQFIRPSAESRPRKTEQPDKGGRAHRP